MLIAIIILGFFLLVGFFFLAVEGYLLWAMHKRLEGFAAKVSQFGSDVEAVEEKLDLHIQKVDDLIKKVTEGETVIIENFTNISKRVAKLEHEIKEAKLSEVKAKEALKAVSRFKQFRNDEADAV